MPHSPEEKLLTRYIVSRTDFVQARALASALARGSIENSYQMCEYLITIYARPFTNAYGLGKLDRNWGIFKSQPHQDMHNRLIELRDQETAHNDLKNKRVFLHWQTVGSYRYTGSVEAPNIQLDQQELSVVVEICDELEKRFQVEIQSLATKLFPNDTRNLIPLLEP